MLSAIELERINEFMVGRGAPEMRDDLGYNVPDFNKLSTIWSGATVSDLYEISNRLLKYFDTQLEGNFEFSKEELKETIEHYKEKKKKVISKPSVTVGFADEFRIGIISFKYNNDFIDVLRKHKFTFDRNDKCWFGPSSRLLAIFEDMKEAGADVENALVHAAKVLEENGIETEETDEMIPEETGDGDRPILSVERLDEDRISLSFDFDNALINQIKALKSKRFDWETKAWIIHQFEARELYKSIGHLGYDITELKPYVEDTSLPKAKVLRADGKDVEFSFPYINEAVEKIKGLTFYQFNKTNTSWIVDVRELHMLIGYLEGILDTTELKEVEIPEGIVGSVKLRDYSYLKRKPYGHQIEAAKFLLRKRKSIVAHEMGSGKTATACLAAYSLIPKRLVICPASLKYNWEKEIRMVDYEGSISVIGDKVDYSSDWIVINYDILEREYKSLSQIDFSCIILDEAHYIKSVSNGGKPDSKRAKYTMALAGKCEYVFSLTGTPITNKPKDVFNLLKISDHILSRNFFSFAKKYCGATHNGFGWDFSGSSSELELHEKLKSIMDRKRKEEMLDLPNKIRRFIPVQIDYKSYNEAVEEYKREKAGLKTKGEHLAYLTTIKHILAKEKVDSTIEIAENILDAGESVVIFTNYNAVADRLMARFKDKATKITGDCKGRERQQSVDDFQSGKKTVMVANIIAAGVGITLVKANNLIFNDMDWVPSNHFQAEDRIHRIGQENKCVINYVYASGAEIDEYMADMLETKSTYINKIVDGGAGDQLDIQTELLRRLYKTA